MHASQSLFDNNHLLKKVIVGCCKRIKSMYMRIILQEYIVLISLLCYYTTIMLLSW